MEKELHIENNEKEQTILNLVEDDKVLNQLIKGKLVKAGYKCDSFYTGKDYIEYIENCQELPTLLLVDYNLPDMNAPEIINQLNALKKGIPFVVLTGHGDQKIAVDMMKRGAIDYFIKEQGFLDLLPSLINQAVNRLKVTRQLADSQIALRKSEEKYRTIFENISDIFFELDESGIILEISPSVETAFNFIRKQVINQSLFFDDKILQQFLSIVQEKKIVSDFEIAVQTPLNKKVFCSVSAQVMISNEDASPRIVGIMRDITERKHAEIAIKESKEKYKQLNAEMAKQKLELEIEKRKTEKLLLNILPAKIAEELIQKGFAQPQYYKQVSVLFADIEGFSHIVRDFSPIELVEKLDEYFYEFDEIIEKFKIEKIKTIGDCYMCAAGIPVRNQSNPIEIVIAGLQIQQAIEKLKHKSLSKKHTPFELRLGIHTGEIVAGVVGKNKFAYDIWGNAVNKASRIVAAGQKGKVNISGATYNLVKEYFDCTYRGKIATKSNLPMEMYFVNRINPEYSADAWGIVPNEKMQESIIRINMQPFEK